VVSKKVIKILRLSYIKLNYVKNLNCNTVLPLIKEAQQHHGLRHGDYQRYRYFFSQLYLVTFSNFVKSTFSLSKKNVKFAAVLIQKFVYQNFCEAGFYILFYILDNIVKDA